MILNSQEIHALTGYARPCKQIEALKTMGVGFKEYDGRPIVLPLEDASKLLQHSDTKTTADQYFNRPTKLKAVR
jgi:hypothetical protein